MIVIISKAAQSVGSVSIWVGTLVSRGELNALLAEPEGGASIFCAKLGIDWLDHDFCESHCISIPIELDRLLGCFSYASSFLMEALAATTRIGCSKANSAILVYDSDFSAGDYSQKDFGMTFIGSFHYRKDASPVFPIPS